MGNTGRLLDNDEVEFLLHGGRGGAGRPSDQDGFQPQRQETPREITMRGDLDKINLSDIFQTLAMSKMEGLLRVRSTLESREVHFKDGFIRALLPRRIQTLRLGQRLVRSGILSAEQIRFALLEQRKSRKNFGDILVEQQLCGQDEIDDIVHNQIQEDLFALFTWPYGTFEFYKGAVTDTVLLDRIAQTPPFDVNGVLLEVARRSDEWGRVMEAVGSLEEIVVVPENAQPDDLGEAEKLVFDAADGRLSIRDLADTALIPLFECGLVVRELLAAGHLRRLTMEEGIAAATSLADCGEPRRAATAGRALVERPEPRDPETTKRLGDLLARCGEQREAAAVVLGEAKAAIEPEVALELARHARQLDPRSADVLAYLTHVLRQDENADPGELADALTDLCDALADRADYEDALGIVTELEASTGDLALCRPRSARILAKLGRQDEAVEALLGLVEVFKEQGDIGRVAATYEQILKIDYRRKDVAKLLKSLHAGKLAKRTKAGAIAATVVALLFVGYVQVQAWVVEGEIQEVRTKFSELLSAGNFEEASALVQHAGLTYGDEDPIMAMRAEIQNYELQRAAAAKRELQKIRARVQEDATGMFQAGQVVEALDAIDGLAPLGFAADAVHRTVRDALAPTTRQLDAVRTTLPGSLPAPPALAQGAAEQSAILERLTAALATPERTAALALHEHRADPRLKSALGKDHIDFVAELEAIARAYQRAEELREAYAERVDQRNIARELTPLFHEARDHEKAFRFEAALEAYRTLVQRHPHDDPLRDDFEQRVERYSTILRFLRLIEEATARGEFGAAQGQLRALKRQFPNVPFDSIARLPVRVRTTPPGARVLVDGQPVGTAPLVTSYRPAADTRIRVELEGFQPEETVVTGDSVGLVRSMLARLPHWTVRRDTTVDRAPVADAAHRVFVTDRTGTVSCLRVSDGAVLWSFPTGDLSGLLTGVAVTEDDGIVFASIDGTLRCIRRADGQPKWTAADLPTESTPVISGEIAVVATDDARAVGVWAKDGAVLWTTALEGPVRADLVRAPDGTVVAVTSLGQAVGIEPRSGRIVWRASVGRGVVCTPALAERDLVVVAEDGQVTYLDAVNGNVRWRSTGFPSLVLTPGITAQSVLVPDGRELHVLDRRNGSRGETLRFDDHLRTPLSVTPELVFVGDARGVVRALGTDDLEPRFLLRADGPALAPVTVLPDGTLLVAFQDRTVRAFRPVPR